MIYIKKIIILIFLCQVLFLFSCGKKTSSVNNKNDSIWNEKVQDKFYDMELGDSLSITDIVTIMYSKGFSFVSVYSNDNQLRFKSSISESFSFGGLHWEHLDIYRKNDIFTGIDFYNVSKDKTYALEDYKSIKETLQNKYKATPQEPVDTITYAVTNFYGRNNIMAQCYCKRAQSVGKEIFIYTHLCYIYKINIVSNDL